MESEQWRLGHPLKRHDSHVAEQMMERAAGLARDSHARTRHAARPPQARTRQSSSTDFSKPISPSIRKSRRFCSGKFRDRLQELMFPPH